MNAPSVIRMDSPYGIKDAVVDAVAQVFNVAPHDIISRRKWGDAPLARHVAMYLVRQRTEMSLPAIGRLFDRDHSTVQSACRRISQRVDDDPILARCVMRANALVAQEAGVRAIKRGVVVELPEAVGAVFEQTMMLINQELAKDPLRALEALVKALRELSDPETDEEADHAPS